MLIVREMDRLGRNAIDVAGTIERLSGMGVRVPCLAPGGVDLTSSAGKMTMGVINAVAQFGRAAVRSWLQLICRRREESAVSVRHEVEIASTWFRPHEARMMPGTGEKSGTNWLRLKLSSKQSEEPPEP